MKKLLLALLLFGLDALAMFLFKNHAGFFFPAYRNLSKSWIAFLASLTSSLKVAVKVFWPGSSQVGTSRRCVWRF